MNCPACGHANRDDARFCGECAAPLTKERACPACGRLNPPGQKFCDGCAHPLAAAPSPAPARDPRDYTPRHLADKILQSKSALEGERKQVTVLFADVKGSLELAGQVDPEEWHRILDRFFQILAEGVHRFEGTINQYTGDGIMALFGAPIAHEDHAQRACYAALWLRDELKRYADELRMKHGLSFSVRMGINSGEVIVGKIGDDLRMDYTAQGHTVGLAQRMEELADGGHALLTEHTAKLVEGYFELRDIGRTRVRGVAQPLGVAELEGPGPQRTRLERSRARGFSKFVGREPEMELLERALERAGGGRGEIIGIVGEAGIGKSRLCLEFVERVRARGVITVTSQCLAHARHAPLVPVLDMYRQGLGITERDDPQVAREKASGRLLLRDPDLVREIPWLFVFLGIPDAKRPAPQLDPEALIRKLQRFTLRYLSARARAGETAVLVLEDLHWLDAGTEAFLPALLDAVSQSPTLFIGNYRPEYHPPWLDRPEASALLLEPLGAQANAALLDDLLGRDPSLDLLRDRIVTRTAGNPFFAEEVVQSLIDDGALEGPRGARRLTRPVEEIRIPESVQAVLAARIDQLGEREKVLLWSASAIGRSFTRGVLERVADLSNEALDAALATLDAREMVFEESLYPERTYAFKHPLTHDVAYRSQLGERRRRTHAAVARAIEAERSHGLDEAAALIAEHWEQADEPFDAARWHARAAKWPALTSQEARARHWRKVRDHAARTPTSDEADTLRLEAATGILGLGWSVGGFDEEEVTSTFREARALAEARHDPISLCALHAVYAVNRGVVFEDLADYERFAREAVRYAEQAKDPGLLAVALAVLMSVLDFSGRLDEAAAAADRALADPPADPQAYQGVFGWSSIGYIASRRALNSAFRGRLDEAEVDCGRAAEFVRRIDPPEWWSELGAVHAAYLRGDGPAALAGATRVRKLAGEIESPFFEREILDYEGIARILLRDWDRAVSVLERNHATNVEAGIGKLVVPWHLSLLAEALSGRGDHREALSKAQEALAQAERNGTPVFTAVARLATARAHVGLGQLEAAAEDLDRADALLEATGARGFAPRALELRARLTAARGEDAETRRLLERTLELDRKLGATGHAARLEQELAS